MRDAAIRVAHVAHRYKKIVALDDVSLVLPPASTTAVVGPDGVGKSTLLSLIAGARAIQSGQVEVLGSDMTRTQARNRVAPRIAFMPQGLGKNLYPSLSVAENIDFFARLYATSSAERAERSAFLMKSTGLDPFADRPAGKLSGGMRQKLSLCCALVHDPDLLILDEPTTGIDPLSRQQFWQLIDGIRHAQPDLTLIVATAYMEEAERFDYLVAVDAGHILAAGRRDEVLGSVGAASVEEAYVKLRNPEAAAASQPLVMPPRVFHDGAPAIEAEGLTKRFGDFTAVDAVSFRIERGEIFGFLGSNGCGKTTTMKMLTGLVPASEGHARLLGRPVDATDLETRRRVGYMSQSFSLYGELGVRANLELHAKLYRLDPADARARVADTLERFDLVGVADVLPAALALGVRQRLQLAVACLHRPEVLILDEPTSGVDPEARDKFWRYLVALSRDDGVTIFISTHFVNEAERCDRLSFMHAGKVLTVGTPAEIRARLEAPTLERAFIACLQKETGDGPTRGELAVVARRKPQAVRPAVGRLRTWLTWVGAFAKREAQEVVRDRVRLSFIVLAPLVLLVTFALGISFDIEKLPYSVFDRDRSAQSQSLALHLSGSRYFDERRPVLADFEIDARLQSGEASLIIEIPPGFGRDLLRGHAPTIGLWLDGANPARANTARGYAEGITRLFIADFVREDARAPIRATFELRPRFLYNQDFVSVVAITPGVIMFLVMLIMAMTTALGVVREREIGSIINLSVSPATTDAFLIGKALPYVVIGSLVFLAMVLTAVFLLGVPVKGSVAALALGGVLYILTATTFGIFVSSFVRTQVAAIFVCAILTMLSAINFSGFLQPVSNLSPEAQVFGVGFPAFWFQSICLGVFTKGLPFSHFVEHIAALAVFPAIYVGAAWLILPKQER